MFFFSAGVVINWMVLFIYETIGLMIHCLYFQSRDLNSKLFYFTAYRAIIQLPIFKYRFGAVKLQSSSQEATQRPNDYRNEGGEFNNAYGRQLIYTVHGNIQIRRTEIITAFMSEIAQCFTALLPSFMKILILLWEGRLKIAKYLHPIAVGTRNEVVFVWRRKEIAICHHIYVSFMTSQGCACHIKSYSAFIKDVWYYKSVVTHLTCLVTEKHKLFGTSTWKKLRLGSLRRRNEKCRRLSSSMLWDIWASTLIFR